mgnify:CR=1 FL=1
MSKNELQNLLDNTLAKSYKDKVVKIEEYLTSIADGENIVVGSGSELIYPDMWEYKHSFGDGVYIRDSYGFFLLSGVLASSKESGVEEFIAPCYIISPRGSKRIVYAIEDCVITTVHANPTNTQDLKEIEQNNVVFNWKEYEEYLKNKL